MLEVAQALSWTAAAMMIASLAITFGLPRLRKLQNATSLAPVSEIVLKYSSWLLIAAVFCAAGAAMLALTSGLFAS